MIKAGEYIVAMSPKGPNSQVKGPLLDRPLESVKTTDEAIR